MYALFTRPLCKFKVGYSYDLKFLAVNETLVDKKQGVRFGQPLVCDLVKVHGNLPNLTLQHTKPHILFSIDKISVHC